MKRNEELIKKDFIEKHWYYVTQILLDQRTDLLYDLPVREVAQCPLPEETERVWPNPCGYGTGTEDAMIYGGTFLDACICRYELVHDRESEETADRLVLGMIQCANSAYSEGFLPRSVMPSDKRSHYIDSSRDQYTMFLYGIFRYLYSPFCKNREREGLKRILNGFAIRAEKNVRKENGYDLLRDDGGPSLNCIMWGEQLGNHEFCRLPAIYLTAWKATGEQHWLTMYRAYREEAYQKSLPMTKYWHLYTLQQMQAALYICREADPDSGWKERYEDLMKTVSDYTLKQVGNYTNFLNNLKEARWRPENFRQLPMEKRDVKAWEGLPSLAPVYEGAEEMFLLQDLANIILITTMPLEGGPTEDAMRLFAEGFRKIDITKYRGPLPVHFLAAYYRMTLWQNKEG